MTVSTFNCGITVRVSKSISSRNGRADRFPGQGGHKTGPVIDITPYLSEQGLVQTQKSIYQPAGTFTIVLSDNPHDYYMDTLYGLVEPMDIIEIRMARSQHPFVLRDYPLVMRGVVRNVQRSETMSPDGRPLRSVIIRGADFGVFFQLVQMLYLVAYAEGKAIIETLPFFSMTGIDLKPKTPTQWLSLLCDNVVNPFIAKFMQSSNLTIPKIIPKCTVTAGTVASVKDYQGSLWDLMVRYADLPWNELFVRDTEDEVQLIHRPLPWMDVDNQWIQQQGQSVALPDSEIIDVTMDEIQKLMMSRQDAGVSNLYRIDHGSYSMMGGPNLMFAYDTQNAEKSSIYTDDPSKYPNSNPALYGARPMNVTSTMYWTGLSTDIQSLPKAEQEKAAPDLVAWIRARRMDLIALNKDNVMFEDGTARLRGDERLQAGRYIRIRRHNYQGIYAYCYMVRHTYVPYQSFTTDVQFARASGFIERTKRALPYLDDGKGGIYE